MTHHDHHLVPRNPPKKSKPSRCWRWPILRSRGWESHGNVMERCWEYVGNILELYITIWLFNIAMENPLLMKVLMGISSINGPFSMAMLNNPMVYNPPEKRCHFGTLTPSGLTIIPARSQCEMFPSGHNPP